MGSININWNQLADPVTEEYWKVFNSDYATVTFENGVATCTVIQNTLQVYYSAIVGKTLNKVWNTEHLYYFSQEIKSNTKRYFVIIAGSTWAKREIIQISNEWTKLKAIVSPNINSITSDYWLAYPDSNSSIGEIREVRNPIIIDLTQMYGAGNEPSTVEEFEHQCEINGINLDEYQPYTTGIIKSWRTSGDGTLSTATTSGNIASFWSPTRADIKSCKVYFTPIQEGSGDPSPTNVRNINGWNGINGCHTRKNLLNIDALISSPSNIVNNFNFKHYLELKLKPNTYYTVSTSYNDSGLNVLYANGTNGDKSGVKADTPRTILSSSNGIVFLMLYDRDGIEKFENKEVTVQLEEGNIVTSYESINNISVSWESEVGALYGGYVDLVTGILAKEWVYYEFDGTEAWFLANDNSYYAVWGYKAAMSDLDSTQVFNWLRPGLYSWQQYGRGRAQTNGAIVIGNDGDTPWQDIETFKAYLADHHLQICYKMATPITYQLTPQAIKTLIGRNNIWSNVGEIEVEYDLYESADITLAKKKIYLSSPHIETVHSGNTSDSQQIAAFKTDMNSKIKSLKVSFAPIQEGSGDPSPTNIRPISGYTGLTVKQAGINLLQCDTFTNGNSGGVNMVGTRNADGEIESISLSGTCTGPNIFRNVTYTPNIFKIMNGTYATNAYSNQANIWLGTDNYNYKDQDGHSTANTEGADWKIFEVGEVSGVTRTYTLARIQGYPYATGIVYDSNIYPMMCLAQDQGCEFEPYKGIDIPISWQSEAEIIYGGYIDLISGELVATHKKITLVGNEDWLMTTSTLTDAPYRPNIFLSDAPRGIYTAPVSDKLKGTIEWQPHLYNIVANNMGRLLIGVTGDMSTKEAVNNWIQDLGGIDVIYQLAKPIIYQLSPQQIKTFIGRNNIWSDAGNVEIKYWTH